MQLLFLLPPLKEINKYGRFLEPILTQILRHTTDPQLKIEEQRLLEEMKQAPPAV